MLDLENRIFTFGDGDMKVAFNPFGIMFGYINSPEDVFESNLFMGALDIIDFYEALEEMEQNGELERKFNSTTLRFKDYDAMKQLKQSVLVWGKSLKMNADVMDAYVSEKLATDFPDVDVNKLLGNDDEPEEAAEE